MSDDELRERVRAALVEIDGLARDVDPYDYGLPLSIEGQFDRLADALIETLGPCLVRPRVRIEGVNGARADVPADDAPAF